MAGLGPGAPGPPGPGATGCVAGPGVGAGAVCPGELLAQKVRTKPTAAAIKVFVFISIVIIPSIITYSAFQVKLELEW
jgi:hypothetical protein